ncbi:MAG: ATPase, T2SS/T4P/T4SS family, partial [Peptococcaceae bacterium]|nr:ATPase, T2SS/T4P/T4SS family [Peptococcaceae bacterium]
MSIFSKAVAAGATDLHLESGGSIYMRRLGRLVFESACSSTMFAEINGTLQTAAALDDSIVNREAREVKDFSCALPEVGRLRVRRYLANGRECLAIRLLPQQIPEAEALGWPEAVLPLCQLRQGLILVTGASGSGKSTTLAAMIEQINRTRACHILTYESP